MSDHGRPPSNSSGDNDVERLLYLAEDIQEDSEREISTLTRYRIMRYLALIPAIPAVGLAAFFTWTSRGTNLYFLGFLAIAVVASGVVFVLYVLQTRQQQRRINRRIQANQRALFELMQLLDETEGLVTDNWSPFEKAQFRVRLARLWMLPSSITEEDWVATSLASSATPSISLSASDLTRARLANAQLPLVNLAKAVLREADLTRANLQEANLAEAILDDAKLTKASLDGANLSDASLTGANLEQADLTNADLTKANLEKALLSGASLKNADLAGANLIYAIVTYDQLAECRSLMNTILPNGKLHRTRELVYPADEQSS